MSDLKFDLSHTYTHYVRGGAEKFSAQSRCGNSY